MEFLLPSVLVSLLLIPIFLLFYVRRHKEGVVIQPGGLSNSLEVVRERLGVRQHIPVAILLLAFSLLTLALARPKTLISLPRVEGTIVLAFDVSRSMSATDIQPTRMEVAKAAAKEFVTGQPSSVLIGVVAFSDSGFSVQVPTDDQGEVLAAIDRLVPERGTALGAGIYLSLETILGSEEEVSGLYTDRDPPPTPEPTAVPEGTFAPAAIVLLTDGENNEQPDPFLAAEMASARGVRIYTIGLGSPLGSTIEVEGYSIQTKLNQRILEDIARMTEGTYFNAMTAGDLHEIYENLDPQLVVKREDMEVTSLFAGAGLILLLAAGLLSLLWFGRFP
jgi:Ca-activated chloride channel family protein